MVALTAGRTLQREINELPSDVEVLTIRSSGGYDDRITYVFTGPQLLTTSALDFCHGQLLAGEAVTDAARSSARRRLLLESHSQCGAHSGHH